ncbi:MAG: UvrD-helicase domain-containing protein [Candidatus Omnitrophica bacterium]|nr:UvrD-helicase domain-containing protein [Candidatus Omnitrophota bacterium]
MNRPANELPPFHSAEIVVVEASAGSGKTYALARRYVQLLLLNARGGDPLLQPPFRSILALTFTNKAAFEMKRRILDLLQRIAFGELPPREAEDILASVGIAPEAAAVMARGAMEALIRNYNYFLVQNIDKFINTLLVGCAFKVGLTANFRIRTNQREYIEYALDGLIDAASTDAGARRLCEDFIDNYLYLENRSRWLPRDGILDILQNLFKVYDDHGLPFARQDISPGTVIAEKKRILALMNEFAGNIPPETLDARFVKALSGFLERHRAGFDFDSLSDYFAREEAPVRKGALLPAGLDRLWEDIRSAIRRLAHLEVFCLYNPYLAIFDGVRGRYEAACRREDVLFLSELNRKARAVFEAGVTPEELYYRLASRFRHYLLDEFQDTSRLQWKNLRVLPEEALSTGGSLFYVGDKKQAIYAFRGGEAGLFDAVAGEFAVEHIQRETLSTNWRSRRSVVDFNNAVFDMDNLARFVREKDMDADGKVGKEAVGFSVEDLSALRDIYGAAQQQARPGSDGGHVRMEYVDAPVKEESLELVKGRFLSLLGELSPRFAWRDVAVLARSNGELAEITRWLLEADIPATSEHTSSIKEHPLVLELVAFLQFLHTPPDNTAFAAFVLGDIFTRVSGLSSAQVSEFLLEERRKAPAEREACLYRSFRVAFPVEWERYIGGFYRNAGLYPLYELIVSLYAQLKVLESFPGAHGFLMHFLELVKSREDEYFDAGAFLADFAAMEGPELYVRLSAENAVRLLTFHKAKGLEFPVVILPFLAMKVDVGSGGSDKKQAYVLRESKDSLQFLRIKRDYGKYSEEVRELYEDEYRKNFLSELNIVYVALTRASSELYGFIPAKAGNSRNLVRKLIPESVFRVGEPGPVAPRREEGAESRRIPAAERRDWLAFLRDEFSDTEELVTRLERESGTFYHAVLAEIGACPPGQSEHMLAEALSILPLEAPRQAIRDALAALLAEARVRPFFETSGQVFTERELVDRRGNSRRVDRMIVTPSEVVVVDFKSARGPLESGLRQVREYREILRDIYPERKVRGYLVFIREREVLEVD